MTTPSFDALVFDLDGTLIDSAPAVRAALNKTLAGLGLRGVEAGEMPGLIGHGARVTVERSLALAGADAAPDRVERALAAYLDFYLADLAASTVVYDGVIDSLAEFHRQGVDRKSVV